MAKDDIVVPEPWEQQEGESSKAYQAFCEYRDMGANRSIRKLAQKINKSVTWLGEWSKTYDWVKRCQAWDSEQDRIARQAQLDEIVKMRKRHAKIAETALEKVLEALASMDPEEMSNADITRMMDTASKLERISRGDVGDVIEERDGGEALDPVQIYIPSNGRENGNSNFDDIEV